ncbi:hypothetical protein Golomagni_06030 [Golovinomyces magnicellulatus]|nr:hypothetical protein Golomagni_06030 [Golovinomyces magnicellulatus]
MAAPRSSANSQSHAGGGPRLAPGAPAAVAASTESTTLPAVWAALSAVAHPRRRIAPVVLHRRAREPRPLPRLVAKQDRTLQVRIPPLHRALLALRHGEPRVPLQAHHPGALHRHAALARHFAVLLAGGTHLCLADPLLLVQVHPRPAPSAHLGVGAAYARNDLVWCQHLGHSHPVRSPHPRHPRMDPLRHRPLCRSLLRRRLPLRLCASNRGQGLRAGFRIHDAHRCYHPDPLPLRSALVRAPRRPHPRQLRHARIARRPRTHRRTLPLARLHPHFHWCTCRLRRVSVAPRGQRHHPRALLLLLLPTRHQDRPPSPRLSRTLLALYLLALLVHHESVASLFGRLGGRCVPGYVLFLLLSHR